jgi:hypothetical protein
MARLMVRIMAGIYLVWLVLTLLIAMPALNFLAPWFMQTQYGRELRTDIIIVNPFTLAVEVRGAELREPDGSPFASLDIARVNLSLGSLLGRALVFDDITLSGLDVHLRRLPDESLNIDDLLDTGAEEESTPVEEPASVPRLTIAELQLHASRIAISDEARETPFHTQYDDLSIDVIDLSTVMEDGKPYQIDVFAESGGSLHWRGTVSLPGANSEGRLEVRKLSLITFWRFAEPWLNFDLVSGALNLSGDYTLSWSEGFRYAVEGGSLSLDKLDIQPRDPAALPDTRAQLLQVAATGLSVDSDSTGAIIESVVASGLDVTGWSEGETFSLVQLFDLSGLPASESAEPTPANVAPEQTWTAHIGRVALENSSARWRSEYTDPPLLVVAPLRAEIRDLRWPLSGDSPLVVDLAVNEQTTLKVDGALALGNGTGSIGYQLADLPLSWANPNLPDALKATITDGALQIAGEVVLADFLPSTVALDGAVTNFAGRLLDAEDEETLTRWDTVRWQQLVVDLDNREVSLSKLLIQGYEGRVHIAEDGSVNASKVWQQEVGERAEEIAHDLELDTPWEVDIAEILISSSAIDFKDESLPLPFRTVIGDVNGEILDIGTDPAKRSTVNIEGEVDGYAPVTLTGTAAPLLEPPALDLTLTFNGVDLVLLSPYSGTYAGYAIERGLLNMELAYSLEDNHLKGRNDIVINQLKLGEKVESDKALDLPIELALALLTDINGIIDLKVPVEGDVNDPQFAIGSVVADAIVNLITKAVTAPFALLASLVGSDDDLQRLPFAVGSAEITESGLARLDQLAEALEQRPQLVLVIRGQLNRAADTEGLQEQALTRQLVESGLSQASIDNRDPEYLEAVERRYAQLGSSDGEASFNAKYKAVLAAIPIDTAQLEQLVQARAVAVKEHLVNNHGLPADRSAIELPGTIEEADGYSGVELDLTN